MASTYTPAGIELIADGEQSTTWGDTTNTNWELMEEMIAGIVSIALSSTSYTLTTSDGATSNGRHAVVVFTGSPGGTCTVTVSPNDMQKVYWIVNGSDQTVTMTQGSGGDVDVAAGSKKAIYCDGAGAGAEVVDLTSGLDVASLRIGGTAVTSTAAELNILDGVTSTTAELNILDGVTASAAELNYNDGASPGTIAASKTVVADASSKIPLGSTWKVYESGGYLYFETSGVGKAKLDSSGNMTIVGSVTAGGTI
jgi:hypothetical protein